MSNSNLMVRLDDQSKLFIAQAAEMRHVSISDYVRMVTVAQARREVESAKQDIISLGPEEQLSFWNALSGSPTLTEAQQELGAIMRGRQ